jgi:hypothetical protein
MEQMMMCTACMSNYYLCNFLKIIYNINIEKNNMTDNNVYILHVKRYVIRTYSELRR